MLRPETARWQGYLEDTITIDWQTPPVMEKSRVLCDGCVDDVAKARAVYAFVRSTFEVRALNERGRRALASARVLPTGVEWVFPAHRPGACGGPETPLDSEVTD